MASWKNLIGVILLLACIATIRWAYRVGEAKFIYQVTPLEESISIPIVYDYYSGSATRVGEGRVKVVWGPVEPLIGGAETVVTCIGSIPAGGDRSYILDIDGALYVERGEFIEPLIAALRYHERHGTLPPGLIEAMNDPELDRDSLAEILAEIAQRR